MNSIRVLNSRTRAVFVFLKGLVYFFHYCRPEKQIPQKIEYKCEDGQNCSDIMVPADDNETTKSGAGVVTLESAQQLICAIDNHRHLDSSSCIEKSSNDASNTNSVSSKTHVSSVNYRAENKRCEIENLMLEDLKCQKCNLIFKNLAAKISHDVTYHLVPTFENDRQQTSGQPAANEIEASKPAEETVVSCSHCTYSKWKVNNAVTSVPSHKTILHVGKFYTKYPNAVRCFSCQFFVKPEKQFWKENLQDLYWMTVHLSKKDPLLCFLCGTVVPKKGAMKRHLLVHKDSSENSYACKVCEKIYSFDEIKDHIFSQKCIAEKLTIDGLENSCLIACKAFSAIKFPTKSLLDFYGSSVCEVIDIPNRPEIRRFIKNSGSSPDEFKNVTEECLEPDKNSDQLPLNLKVSF